MSGIGHRPPTARTSPVVSGNKGLRAPRLPHQLPYARCDAAGRPALWGARLEIRCAPL